MEKKNYNKLNIPDWVWWVGIIEDRGDLSYAGRYKVRIMGYHSGNKKTLPTKDLPFASVVNSPTNAATSGIMENPALLPGSTVIGFFADGNEGQMPVIIGSLAGIPQARNEDIGYEDGFADPGERYPRGGFGEEGPTGLSGVGEPDISRLARNEAAEKHYTLLTKRLVRAKGVVTAKAPSVVPMLDDKEGVDYEGKTWEEPYARGQGPYDTFKMEEFKPKYWDAIADLKKGESGNQGVPDEPGTYTSMYPFNQVRETEAGFVTEYDNTSGNTRYSSYHPVGNYEEVQADGTRINRIMGSDYEITIQDKNVIIQGACNVTIAGDAKVLVKGDKYEEIEGNHFVTVHKDRITAINGNDVKQVGTDQQYTIGGLRHARVAGDDSTDIHGKQTQSVAKTKTENIGSDVTETFGKNHINTVVGWEAINITKTQNTTVGENMIHTAGEESYFLSAGNQFLGSNVNQSNVVGGNITETVIGTVTEDYEGTHKVTAPTADIVYDAGEITVNTITQTQHTHQTTSMDTGNGANSGGKNASDSPNSGT